MEVQISPPGLLPGRGWLRRHAVCSAYPCSYEERTGQRMASYLFGVLVPSLPPAAEQQWPTPGLGSSSLKLAADPSEDGEPEILDGCWEEARLHLGCLSTELGVWVFETWLTVAECGKEGARSWVLGFWAMQVHASV